MGKQATEQTEAPADEAVPDIEVVGEVLLPPRVQENKFELRISPYAWAKICWIRDYCKSEIAGFGISSMADPFYMEDFRTIKQEVSNAHFEFDDDALNDYLADMFEEGKQPGECMRLWVHTHPTNDFASPSSVDEETFLAAFGNTDWAMMIIVDEGNNVYARLRVKSGASKMQMIMPFVLDWQPPFKAVDEAVAAEWKKEVEANISRAQVQRYTLVGTGVDRLPAHHRHHPIAGPHGDLDYGLSGFMDDLRDQPTDTVTDWENVELLLMGEERVMEIAVDNHEGGPMVLLNNAWLIYSGDVTPTCREGDIISSARAIAAIPPQRCGELYWTLDKKSGIHIPQFESEVIKGLVEYFDGEGEALPGATEAASAEVDDGIEILGEVRVGHSGP